MSGVGSGIHIILSIPYPPKSFLFNRTFLKTHPFLLFSWALWSWSMPESQGQVILQKAWNCAQWPWSNWSGRTQQHLLWLVPLLPDLNQYVFVCSLQTYVATSCSHRFSVSPWSWVWSGWKEIGRKNEVSWHGTLSGLGNQGLWATAQCQCFMTHLLCF